MNKAKIKLSQNGETISLSNGIMLPSAKAVELYNAACDDVERLEKEKAELEKLVKYLRDDEQVWQDEKRAMGAEKAELIEWISQYKPQHNKSCECDVCYPLKEILKGVK